MRTFSGLLLLVTAMVLGVAEILAIADPAGTAMANDSDPFGPAAPWQDHAMMIVLIAAMIWAAFWFLNRGLAGRMVRGRGLVPEARR